MRAADVSREEDVERYLAVAVERFGRIDLHHLNAGIPGSLDPLPGLELDAFERVLAVNVTSVFLGLRGAFRQYAAQRSGGAVVVTGSIASLRGSADLFAYHTSKHAVLGLARCAAVYGGPLGVRVNVIAPGIVPTELFAAAGGAVGGGSDMAQRPAPPRCGGRARRTRSERSWPFLLSDDAAYMTGEVVSVDGARPRPTRCARRAGPAGGIRRSSIDDPQHLRRRRAWIHRYRTSSIPPR
jgi:NAD(P)-dependent dehydrogenase (short-subunit alcohol dehydrogenase family)